MRRVEELASLLGPRSAQPTPSRDSTYGLTGVRLPEPAPWYPARAQRAHTNRFRYPPPRPLGMAHISPVARGARVPHTCRALEERLTGFHAQRRGGAHHVAKSPIRGK